MTPESQFFSRMEAIFGDNKYHNHDFEKWLREHSKGQWRLEISSRPADKEKGRFQPVRIRWVVERTFA